VLSCDGGRNRAWRHPLAGLLGQWREVAAQERVGRCGRPGPAGPKSKESFITYLVFQFQWISNSGKTLEICTRRFRRNFEMGIFPKFF
jgi:hypothetical protein